MSSKSGAPDPKPQKKHDLERSYLSLQLRESLGLIIRLGGVPIGPKVVPFCGSCLEFYKVIQKRNYFGAYG